jgi:hypothetical protein
MPLLSPSPLYVNDNDMILTPTNRAHPQQLEKKKREANQHRIHHLDPRFRFILSLLVTFSSGATPVFLTSNPMPLLIPRSVLSDLQENHDRHISSL